jgi:hypothetical protein
MTAQFLSINAALTSPAKVALTAMDGKPRKLPQASKLHAKTMVVLDIIVAVLVADFISGFFHWLEDAYGREDWPITGRLVTKPNILHHRDARYFTRHSWFHSSWLLVCLGVAVLVSAWVLGVLTWQVWLVAILGINANQIHKWAHRTPFENGPLVSMLQHLWLVQTPRHHAQSLLCSNQFSESSPGWNAILGSTRMDNQGDIWRAKANRCVCFGLQTEILTLCNAHLLPSDDLVNASSGNSPRFF